MKRLSSRDRTLLSLLLTVLLSLAGFLGFVLPLRSEGGRLRQDITAQQKRLKTAEEVLRSVPQKRKTIKQLQAEIVAISRPNESPIPEVVREIESITKQQGVRLSYIHPAEPEYLETSTRYSTAFGVQASFEKIVPLLFELEHASHVLWVDGVELSADRDPGNLRAAITVSVYSRRSASKPAHAKS